MNAPIDPDTVLFGLTFVSFLPLSVLPIIMPPISDKIDTNNEYIINIFISGLLTSVATIKNVTNDKNNKENTLKINLLNLFLKLFFTYILIINP
tara:strand:- start:791 stop:1072 length:282 start_codon:yes stop_codon:yes gene_type:complete